MILIRNATAALVASTLVYAYAALAQTPPAAGVDAATPAAAAAQPAGAPALHSDAKARADADARACLDFVSNVGVIRCAEKYLPHQGKRARPNG